MAECPHGYKIPANLTFCPKCPSVRELYNELAAAARKACSEMGCYCESDPPERTCVMCKLGVLVSSPASGGTVDGG